MIDAIEQLLRNNEAFVDESLRLDPAYFERLAQGQHPQFLWIGCSDSRVAPNRITGTEPGDMFVHRNIANLVVQTDINLLSVLQYAVDVLQVRHVIVCGHYGCGGVQAALGHEQHGLIDNWLRTIKDTRDYYWRELQGLDQDRLLQRMVELNVVEQVYNLGKTSVVQNAWQRGSRPSIHGWVFDLRSGLIKTQTPAIDNNQAMQEICKFHTGVVGH
jgi:carbonic anhydrase